MKRESPTVKRVWMSDASYPNANLNFKFIFIAFDTVDPTPTHFDGRLKSLRYPFFLNPLLGGLIFDKVLFQQFK